MSNSSLTYIPYGAQDIDEEDIRAVAEVLCSSVIARGPTTTAFEAAIGQIVHAPYVVACSSGTAGLHLACLAAGIGPGDEVITSPITFVASANCAAYCGATPVFADIDPDTACIDPNAIAARITARTRAVIPVHFAGQSCDMEAIIGVVRDAETRFGRKIWIIEDSCHVLGSTYRGEPVGSCAYGDMAVFSFHPVKHITTGEGGAVATRDTAIDGLLRRLRGHGITKDSTLLSQQPGPWYYEQVVLGYNYFLTDFQAALGLSQLDKLPRFATRRAAIVAAYDAAFANHPHLRPLGRRSDTTTNFHLYVLRVDFAAMGATRAAVMTALLDRGIQTQVHYIPVTHQPYYQQRYGTKSGDYPIAEKYYDQCLTVPLFPNMSDDDVERVIAAVRETVQSYAKHHA